MRTPTFPHRSAVAVLVLAGLTALMSVKAIVGAAAAAPGTGSGSRGPGSAAAGPGGPLPSFAEPAISPDGSEIAFISAGDIWTVPAAGGEARLLVSHSATESRPLYSPDGARLAFVSGRTGNGDVYVLTFATGD